MLSLLAVVLAASSVSPSASVSAPSTDRLELQTLKLAVNRVEVPRVWLPSTTVLVKLGVTNVGTSEWRPDRKDRLVAGWSRVLGHDFPAVKENQFALPRVIKPGEHVDLDVWVQAPGNPALPRPVWIDWELACEGQFVSSPGSRSLVMLLPPPGRFLNRVFLIVALLLGLRRLLRDFRRQPAQAAAPSRPVRRALLAILPALSIVVGVAILGLCLPDLLRRPLKPANILAFGSTCFLAALPVALAPKRARWPIALALAVVFTLLAQVDLLHFRAFGGILSVSALAGAGQISEVMHSVVALFGAQDWVLLAVPIAIAIIAWATRGKQASGGWAATGLVLLVAGLALPAFRTLSGPMADPRKAAYFNQREAISTLGLAGAHATDVARYLRQSLGSPPLTPAEEKRLVDTFAERAKVASDAQQLPSFGIARGSNLIVIQVEALQEWVVDATVKGAQVMPFLHGLENRALFFPRIFDQTKEGRTSDAEFVTLNSLHPLEEGAAAIRLASNNYLALPEVLRRTGYATYSAHGNFSDFWNRTMMHPKYGIEHMLFRDELGPGELIGFGLSDEVLFERISQKLAEAPRPFFAFLITVTSHHPYGYLPASKKTLDVGDIEGTMLGNYLQSQHYLDQQLERFFKLLAERGLLDSTVIAIYGDHDSGLSEAPELHKFLGLDSFDDAAAAGIDRVPLFIRLPHETVTGVQERAGGQIDTAPTLLHLLGVAQPPCYVGVPLLASTTVPAVSPMGDAAEDDRLWLRGSGGGTCWQGSTREPLPLDRCAGFERARDDETWASDWVLEHNGARRLGCAAR